MRVRQFGYVFAILVLALFPSSMAQLKGYDEDGRVDVATGVAVSPQTQAEFCQGCTVFRPNPSALQALNGYPFTLVTTATPVFADLDLYLYDGAGQLRQAYTSEGDESGFIPRATADGYVILSSGTPAEFHFKIDTSGF